MRNEECVVGLRFFYLNYPMPRVSDGEGPPHSLGWRASAASTDSLNRSAHEIRR